MSDMELVREYAANQSEQAFATLVSRNVDLVHSAALRQVRNHELAEEITQVVFTILARKADRLGRQTIISGWLYRTTRFAAMAALRRECRRRAREKEFMQMESIQSEPESDAIWEQIAPLLDDAMNELNEKDRNAVVLHYFQKKGLREVGENLGTSEDGAQKRVSRAVAKLRALLTRRKAALSAVALTALLSAQAIKAAPVSLSASLGGSTLKGAAASGLVQATLKLMFWAKAKTTVAVGAAMLLVFGATTAVLSPTITRTASRPELQGAWEGALEDKQNGRILRMVLKVARNGDAGYTANLDSIEQGARDIPVSEISCTNQMVRLAVKSLNMTFAGKINENGSEIIGTWHQFALDFPLILKRTDKPSTLDPPLPMSAYVPRPGSDLQGYWVANYSYEARAVRFALKIAEPTNGMFMATLDLIDQGQKNLPVQSLTYAKPEVVFDLAASKTHFEGELNPQGNEISGQWRQWKGKPVSLVFSRADPKEDEIKVGSYAYTIETDLQGIWAGTLNLPRQQLRFLLKIGKTDEGTFTSTLDSIDQGAKDIPTSKVSWTNGEVRLEWQGLGASYYGKLENGKLLGTWQEGTSSMQLDFVRTNLNR